MIQADTIIKNASIITMSGSGDIRRGYAAIKDGKITAVSEGDCPFDAPNVIDARDKLLLPGLINAHMHVPMSLLRGYADDYDLHTWLHQHIFPAEAKYDERCMRAGAMLGIAEMLASGTTSFSDMYSMCDAIAGCVADSGIKANISRGQLLFGEDFDFAGDPGSIEARELAEKWHGYDSGRIQIELSAHAEYTSDSRLWKALADYADEKGLGMHLHLSETRKEHEECVQKYGVTPAVLFDRAGVFRNRTLAAHCVWLSDEDIALLADRGVHVAHNPVSNLKLASGVARVPEMLKSGINVALGTDSVASNNSADMFEEIKLAAILHKGVTLDPQVITAQKSLEMACLGGARAQGRQAECGQIAPGFDADLVLLDISRPRLTPSHDLVSSTVYSAGGSDVVMTMVRGRTLYERGEFKSIDMEKLRFELNNYVMPRLFGA